MPTFLSGDLADLGAFERQIIHQPFLVKDKANHGTADVVGIDRAASADRYDCDRTVDANFPAVGLAKLASASSVINMGMAERACAPS